MKITVALPTKTEKDPLIFEAMEYFSRCRPPFGVAPIFLSPKLSGCEEDSAKRQLIEGDALLKRTEGFYRIALCADGRCMSSEQFAAFLLKQIQVSKIAFLIGGPFGLSSHVLQASQKTLSLSPMTLPHRLAFLVLAEQIFRAGEIMRGTPYHK